MVHPLTEWTISAFAFPAEPGTHLPTPEGSKAELALVNSQSCLRRRRQHIHRWRQTAVLQRRRGPTAAGRWLDNGPCLVPTAQPTVNITSLTISHHQHYRYHHHQLASCLNYAWKFVLIADWSVAHTLPISLSSSMTSWMTTWRPLPLSALVWVRSFIGPDF